MTSLLLDTLDPTLLERIQIRAVQIANVGQGTPIAEVPRTKSSTPAKTLTEFYELVKIILRESEERAGTPDQNKIIFREDEPDRDADFPSISYKLMRREPGAFGGGAPFESRVKNLRPIPREEFDDPDNPGYKITTSGYFYDNIVRFNCWGKTNKTANRVAEQFEDLMELFSWFFKLQGIDRVLFWGRQADHTVELDQNPWHCRPIDYFVRTEKVRVQNVKTIEELLINYKIETS